MLNAFVPDIEVEGRLWVPEFEAPGTGFGNISLLSNEFATVSLGGTAGDTTQMKTASSRDSLGLVTELLMLGSSLGASNGWDNGVGVTERNLSIWQ